MQTTFSNATCESLSYVDSQPFQIIGSTNQNPTIPYTVDIDQALSHFPLVALLALLFLAALTLLRPRLTAKSPRHMMLTTVWILMSVSIVTLASSYWLLPKAINGFWYYHQESLIEPALSGISEVADSLASHVDLEPIQRWSQFINKVYDHHTAKLLVQHKELMTPDETLSLLDTVSNFRNISPMHYAPDLNAQAQIDILADTARQLAQNAFEYRDLKAALKIALQGYAFDGTSQYLDQVVYPIRGEMAHQDLLQGRIDQALENVLAIPPSSWNHQNFLRLIEATQYAIMGEKLSGASPDRWEQTIAVSQRLKMHYLSASGELKVSPHIECNLSYLYSLLAVKHLTHNAPQLALDNLQRAQNLVPDSSYVNELIPSAHYNVGAQLMLRGQFSSAADSFERAYQLKPTKEFACDTAAALRQAAFAALPSQNLDYANSSADKAKHLCQNAQIDNDLQNQIEFYKALLYQQYGRWNDAKKTFQKLLSVPGMEKTAKYFINELPYAEARHRSLINTHHVLPLPTLTGQYCSEFVEQGEDVQCTAVTLFNNDKEVGRSISGSLTDVSFDRQDGYLAIYSNYSDRTYDTWEEMKQGLTSQWIEIDGDGRPDYLKTLAEGQEISVRQLSGKVSMKFIGGLVNKTFVDVWSRPDIFLIAKVNGGYFGRTETADNNTRPYWSDYFVFDYKYGDEVDLLAFDEDLFDDEFVDSVRFAELPTSGLLNMARNDVTLVIEVDPSNLPEGQYTGEVAQSVFNNTAHFTELGPVSEKILDTYSEDARAQIMSTVASIALPEIAIFTLMKRAQFFEKFTAGWIGHAAIDSALNKSNDANNQ